MKLFIIFTYLMLGVGAPSVASKDLQKPHACQEGTDTMIDAKVLTSTEFHAFDKV